MVERPRDFELSCGNAENGGCPSIEIETLPLWLVALIANQLNFECVLAAYLVSTWLQMGVATTKTGGGYYSHARMFRLALQKLTRALSHEKCPSLTTEE